MSKNDTDKSRPGDGQASDGEDPTPPPPADERALAAPLPEEDEAPPSHAAEASAASARPSRSDRRDPLRASWEEDYLVQLAARAEMRRPDSPFYTDPALVAWIDRESRAPERAASGWDAAQVARVAERVRERAEASRLRVALADAPPPLKPAGVVGTVPQVREAAVAAHCAPSVTLSAAAGVGRELWDEPCDQWLEVPADLDAGEYLAMRVTGDSMAPLFRTGDTVLIRLGRRVERDTVVVARHPDDGYLVKRVGRVGRASVELTSLNPAFLPVTVPRSADTVVGTVIMRWRDDATYQPIT